VRPERTKAFRPVADRQLRAGRQADSEPQVVVAVAQTPPLAVGRATVPGSVVPGALADDAVRVPPAPASYVTSLALPAASGGWLSNASGQRERSPVHVIHARWSVRRGAHVPVQPAALPIIGEAEPGQAGFAGVGVAAVLDRPTPPWRAARRRRRTRPALLQTVRCENGVERCAS
jgi:hypothetical protein